jgi:Bifunctional DNA primase/polymerase, N-terminal
MHHTESRPLTHDPDPELLLAAAVELAENGWRVFPLEGKQPRINKAHTRYLYITGGACVEGRQYYPNPQWGCKGGCGNYGHGLYDGTTDLDVVGQWWAKDYPGANIGARVPDPVLVIDIDPATVATTPGRSWSTGTGTSPTPCR